MKYEDVASLQVGTCFTFFPEDDINSRTPIFVISKIHSYSLPCFIYADIHLIGTFKFIQKCVSNSEHGELDIIVGDAITQNIDFRGITIVGTIDEASFDRKSVAKTRTKVQEMADEISANVKNPDTKKVEDNLTGQYLIAYTHAAAEREAELNKIQQENAIVRMNRAIEEQERRRREYAEREESWEEIARKQVEKMEHQERTDAQIRRKRRKTYVPPEYHSTIKYEPDTILDIILSNNFFYEVNKEYCKYFNLDKPKNARIFLHLYQEFGPTMLSILTGVSFKHVMSKKNELVSKYGIRKK